MSRKHYFQPGGALDTDAPSYIERQADRDLLEALDENEVCLVLAPRQTGKSSLMMRAWNGLEKAGVRSGIVDLQQLGGGHDMDKWFGDVAYQIERSLKLTHNAVKWWAENSGIGPTMRFMTFLEDIVLAEIPGRVVIFFDEIDSILPLPFSDDFFTTIRALVNARAGNETLKRLNFVLLGVASPTDFIKEKTRTPFNVGTEIRLTDFDSEALKTYKDVLGEAGESLIDRILYWTSGQPMMVQDLARTALKWPESDRDTDHVDTTVRENYLKTRIETDRHLNFIRSYLLQGGRKARKTLKTYLSVLKSKPVDHDGRDPVHARLKLSGVVRVDDNNRLAARNRIYQSVFGPKWVKTAMPRDIYKMIALGASTALLLVLTWVFLIQPALFPDFKNHQKYGWFDQDIYYTDKSEFALTITPPDPDIRRIEFSAWDEHKESFAGIWKKEITSKEGSEKIDGVQEKLKKLKSGENRYRIRYFGKLMSKNNYETVVLVVFWQNPELLNNLEMADVPAGCFHMGCGEWTSDCNDDEKPVHEVCLDAFQIGKYEVTQEQWKNVMGYNPSYFKKGGRYPVEKVSWNHVQEFIRRLNKLTGKRFRLPTEAEWEYAARSGGKPEKYAGFSDDRKLYQYANFCDNNCTYDWKNENQNDGYQHTAPIGSYLPNGLGIHDMSGNVWEWCRDWYDGDYYTASPKSNPTGPDRGASRVLRGGSWSGDAGGCRSAYRLRLDPGSRDDDFGFRLLCLPGHP